MDRIRLGRTGLMVSASSFGALPIQRLDREDAAYLLRKAYDNDINYFDTAHVYSDSEEKIGYALSGVRENIIISTKAMASDRKTMEDQLEESLRRLKTDYIDVYQLHNPATLPDPDDPDGLYAGLLEAKKAGKIRFIGITNHRWGVAEDAIKSGAYDTIMFPFSSISEDRDIEVAELAHEYDMGFIAMKGLAGGLITDARSTFAFMKRYPFAVPIWGVQRESELDQFIELEKNPPAYEDVADIIAHDRAELAGNFCHGCGYCLPCPANIDIPQSARMKLLLNRSPWKPLLSEDNNERMLRIEDCKHCDHCKNHCPYGLDTPQLLADNLEYYKEFRAEHLAQASAAGFR